MPIDNKEVCRRTFDEIWNQKKIEVADELIAANYVHHDPQSPPCNNLDQYKQFVRYYLNAFPDLHFAIEDQIADGDTVVTRYTATGTHNGDVAGIPATGRRISVTGMGNWTSEEREICGRLGKLGHVWVDATAGSCASGS